RGFTILRFWNNDVLRNIEGVLLEIRESISPSPHPSPTKGRGGKRSPPP
ncbi:DNA (cytosine-5-)-methyltransferase, partial [candidate division WOR-3 bacterium]